jgi:choline dehydrogenase-like flavoprotein
MKNFVLARLSAFFGYIHSAHSAQLEAVLKPDIKQTLHIRGITNPEGKRVANAATKFVARQFRQLGWFPLKSLQTMHPPGGSVHIGGAFPMKKKPDGFQTDLLGRLPGLQRIHITDASIFPSITASTIAFSIMANAHRIATETVKFHKSIN